eukprot:gene13568-14933_t
MKSIRSNYIVNLLIFILFIAANVGSYKLLPIDNRKFPGFRVLISSEEELSTEQAKSNIPIELNKYRTSFLLITSNQWNQLQELCVNLLDWNDKINLISRKEITRHLVSRHLIPSLSVSLAAPNLGKKKTVIDVGTGGGFPGLPLAVVNPDSHFTLLDSSGKKMKVVEDLVKTLGLTNVHCITSRAEEFVGRRFDFLIGRAVTAIPNFLSYSSHLITSMPTSSNTLPQTIEGAEQGLLYLKGGDYVKELEEAAITSSQVKMISEFFPQLDSDKYILFIPSDEIRRFHQRKSKPVNEGSKDQRIKRVKSR